MARKPLNYWEKRNTEMMKRYESYSLDTIKKLVKVYNQAQNDIEKEITRIYRNYAKDGVLKDDVLKELLNKRETDTYYKNLLKAIEDMPNSDIKKALIAKYNAPAYGYRISRYEALKEKIDVELKKMASIEEHITQNTYQNIIKDSYKREIYEIQKGVGLGFSFVDIDTKTVNTMLAENWIADGNFSKRIWNNTEKLGEYLSTHMLADNLSGKSAQKMASELSEAMNVGMFQATRLVRTEANHFANEGEMLAYEECDIEKYQFIATLDQVTCKHCAKLDNQIFNVKDRKVEVNYPPVHSNDRCTTIAYFDDETMESMQRRARDKNGKSVVIPYNMNYEEWNAKYIQMTDTEKSAISKYSGSKAYTLNEKLRNGMELSVSEEQLVSNIDKGLSKLPNYNKITYRQIGFDFLGEAEYNKFINNHKNNIYINYNQYLSTSKNYNDYEVIDKLKVEIIISGKTGKDLRGLAGVKEENEVLFGKDVLFKILKVDENKIWLEEV